MRALGTSIAGIMGNNHNLIQSIIQSGQNHGEGFWELPLPEEYKELLKTPCADTQQRRGPVAGALTAGLFLQEFVPEAAAWAHLDIAGPFLVEKPWKYYEAGAVGFGLKTLVDLPSGSTTTSRTEISMLEHYAKPRKNTSFRWVPSRPAGDRPRHPDRRPDPGRAARRLLPKPAATPTSIHGCPADPPPD